MKPIRSRPVHLAGVLALLLAAGSTVVRSQDAPSRAEQAIKYRQSVYKTILWNFGPMAATVRGQLPYDADDFSRRAERVALLAPMLLEGYPAGSDDGAPTRAKPAIWSNRADFEQLMHSMEGRAANLAEVAKSRDFDRVKAAFGDLGKACSACHDKYRSD